MTFTAGPIEASAFETFILERFRKRNRKVGPETVREPIKHADSVAGDVQELCEAIWDAAAPKAGGTYRFSNPFFKAWLLKRM